MCCVALHAPRRRTRTCTHRAHIAHLSVAISSAEVCVRLRIMRLNCVICLMPSDSLVSACEMGGAELRTVRQESSSQRH